jgi:hypothetical protein
MTLGELQTKHLLMVCIGKLEFIFEVASTYFTTYKLEKNCDVSWLEFINKKCFSPIAQINFSR